MNRKINKLYVTDFLTILLFLSLLIILIYFVTLHVAPLTEAAGVRSMIYMTATLIIAFGTACSLAVLVHLKKNKATVYAQEIQSHDH